MLSLQLRMRSRRRGRIPSPLPFGVLSSAFTQPMLGVVFTLMLIMIILQPSPHHTLPIDRYRSHYATLMPQALRDDAMSLMLTRDGTMYFGNVKVASLDLPGLIHKRVQRGSPCKVFFVVDARAKYWDVSTALDEVREAGISDVAFLAEAPVLHK